MKIKHKIMILSSPRWRYDENLYSKMRELKDEFSGNIIKQENLGPFVLNQIFYVICRGFDGIIIIVRDNSIAEYISIQKYVNEANRLLNTKGFGNQRISICHWNIKDHKESIEQFENAFKRIKDCGLNPINDKIINIGKFRNIYPKKLMNITHKALNNFQFRSLFKAKNEILKQGKYDETNFNFTLDSILDADFERKYILQELKGKKPLALEEIVKFFIFQDDNIVRDIFYLKERGLVEEIIESPINLKDNIRENYFNPVSIIYDNKYCCRCGLCASVCPLDSIELTENYLYIDEGTCITCGLCFSVCPRSFPVEKIYNHIKKTNNSLMFSKNFGYYKKLYSARTLNKNIKEIGQDGGIVTSLLYYLLDNNLVDAVLTIKHSKCSWKPKIGIITNKEDLYKTAGTTYVHSPILSVLNKTNKFERIAIVAVPCKIKALIKGELFSILPFFNNIKYKIGLFCMEAFSYEGLLNFINDKFHLKIIDIMKMEIKQGYFIITLYSGNVLSVPLKDVHKYILNFCRYCDDLTAELADISVGSIGSKIKWSSVITRTQKGEYLFNKAIKHGLIEAKLIEDAKLGKSLINKIAKKKRENFELPQLQHIIQHFC